MQEIKIDVLAFGKKYGTTHVISDTILSMHTEYYPNKVIVKTLKDFTKKLEQELIKQELMKKGETK